MSTNPTKPVTELKAGDRFPAPRADEGPVVAQCDFGKCEHFSDRPDSIHVRGAGNAEWFIALPTYAGDIHVCPDDLCWLTWPGEHHATNKHLG